MKYFLLVFLFIILFAGVSTPVTASSGPLYISAISFSGVHVFKEQELLDVMFSKKPAMLGWKKTLFVEETLDADLERLSKYYENAGYFDTIVSKNLLIDSDKVHIEVLIDEGPPVKVEEVAIASPIWPPWLTAGLGGDQKSDTRLRVADDFSLFPLKSGDVFDASHYNSAKKLLAGLFAENGYAKIKVDGTARIYKQEHQADINFEIEPGEQYVIDSIAVSGNQTVAESIIRRELTIRPGQMFAASRISANQRRLHRMDLFSKVTMTPQWEKEKDRQVPLLLEVEEKPPRGLKVGVGYGSEDKFRALGQIRWRNFLGRGYTSRLTARYSSISQAVEAEFDNPYLWGFPQLQLEYRLGYEVQDVDSYQNRQYYSRVKANYKWNDRLIFYLAQNLESNKTLNLSAAISQRVLDRYGRLEEEDFYISSLEIGGRWKTVKNFFDPQKGVNIFYSLETAPRFFGSEFEFLRQIGEFRGYVPVLSDIVGAFRLKFGTVDPVRKGDYVPISKRFFAGGSRSVRGYAYQELGDKDADNNPLGGNSLLEGSVELRFPIVGELKGVVFLDAGNVFQDSYKFDTGNLLYASGGGLRYQTPLGPIRLDVGYKINPEENDKDRYRIHINFGQAF